MFPHFKMTIRIFASVPVLVPALLIVTIGALSAQTINTVAGNGTASFSGDPGPAASAGLNTPKGLAAAPNGTVYIADEINYRVRAVSAQGTISTFAGNGANTFGGDGGQASASSMSNVLAVAIDGSGNVYIADPGNRRIRKVSTSGVITTIASTGVEGYTGDNGGTVFHSDFFYVTAAAPAKAGETLIVYATGLGPVDTAIVAGQAAPSATLVHTLQNPVVTMGTANAALSFSGLAPSLVAVYQVNFQVPANLTTGNYNLSFNSGGVVSNTVAVPVR
jgi:uncharacterized protein (TIGR03437 family)